MKLGTQARNTKEAKGLLVRKDECLFRSRDRIGPSSPCLAV
jgi:hypothetical protein